MILLSLHFCIKMSYWHDLYQVLNYMFSLAIKLKIIVNNGNKIFKASDCWN